MTEKLSQNLASNLPAELSSFVGRRRELAEAKRLLSSARLLTLIGLGGVGKTRLAIRIATDIRRAFPDGVWLIELADLRNATLLPHTVAAVIGLQDRRASWTVQTLAGYLRDMRMLIVLDNCEHLVDDCAEFAHGLLRAAADLQILATSRESLKALGEQVLTVPPLSTPAEGEPAGDLLHYEAIQLFVARATARLPSFTLDSHNRDDVARLCHRLDGIPLAIELAADRVRAMTPKQINERLTSRLELLSTGVRGVPSRQQTLRASIDWSYELCSDAEKALWARLSVFVGGFDLDAAEGVCAAPDLRPTEIVDLLSSLLEKSVLVREEHGSFVRYRMLEAIKEYGDDRLGKSGERDAIKRRHRDWYAKLVFDAYDQWIGPQQAEWLTQLRLDQPNIRAALELSLADPNANELALRISRALVDYWFARGELSLGRHWLHEALSRCETPCAGQVDALSLSAFLAVMQNDYAAAAHQLNEAERTLHALDDPAGLAFWTFVSGVRAAMSANDFDLALALLDKALAGFRDCGDLTDEIRTLFMLGIASALGGEHDNAVWALQQCLQLTESRSESWFRSYALLAVGIDAWAQSDNVKAKKILRESIRLKQPLEDRMGLAWCYETLAWVSCNEKDDKRASTLLGIADTAWNLAGTAMRTVVRVRDGHDACDAELRTRVPDRVFASCWKDGADLPAERALAYALGDERPVIAPLGEAVFAPLTNREWQIAQAVAEGLSNRQIATRLVIAQRTAEGHVERILTKLGFNSRAQIAAWATERRARTGAQPPAKVPAGDG